MTKSRNLYNLAGTTTRYNCYGVEDANDLIPKELDNIHRDLGVALRTNGLYCIMVMAEMLNYYRKQPYYTQVRSSIKRERYNADILEYLNLDTDNRQARMLKPLGMKIKDIERDAVLTALKYFLAVYPNRKINYKEVLTREEYIELRI